MSWLQSTVQLAHVHYLAYLAFTLPKCNSLHNSFMHVICFSQNNGDVDVDNDPDDDVDDDGVDDGENDLLLLGKSLGVARSSVTKTNSVRMLCHLHTLVLICGMEMLVIMRVKFY